jgi:superfamily II DNA/RNA helicase
VSTAVSTAPSRPNRRRRTKPRTARPVDTVSATAVGLDDELAAAMRRPVPKVTSFAELGVPTAIDTVLSGSGITRPTPIQACALPDALAGRDVLGRAQTGSGKTLAFGVPLLARLHDAPRARGARAPRGLVLVPTRELAGQVAEALAPASRVLGLRIAVVVGGTSISRQIDEIRRGVDVLVATPGRLIDLMERNAVSLDEVAIAVLDEADHMADLGFLPAVTRILDATPDTRQCLLFSATLDRGVDRLATRYLAEPAVHAVGDAGTPVAAMDHRVFRLSREDKIQVAGEIATRPARTLFFVRTKHGADRLARQLRSRGVDAGAIHGNLNQNQRQRALDGFASGRVRVLVATDVAARGIHVDDVDLVVHFDPPNDHKDYLHRSGRTARAGAAGTVICFAQPDQVADLARLHTAAAVRPAMTAVHPGHAAVRAVAATGDPVVVTTESPARANVPATAGSPRRPRRSGRPTRTRPGPSRSR